MFISPAASGALVSPTGEIGPGDSPSGTHLILVLCQGRGPSGSFLIPASLLSSGLPSPRAASGVTSGEAGGRQPS